MSRILVWKRETTGAGQIHHCRNKAKKFAFHVQAASRIHRFNQAKIETTNENVQGMRGNSLGVVQMKDQLLILLDLEGIIGRLSG